MTKPVNKSEAEVKPSADSKKDAKQGGGGGGGGNSLVTNLIITSIICSIFVGANYFIQATLLKSQLKNVGADVDVDSEAKANKPEKGTILDLGQFTMNLSDVEKRRYLKINVAIEVSNPEGGAPKASGGHGGGHGGGEAKDPVLEEMEQYRPAIRDSVISIMTSKTSDELATTAGKELAKQQIADAVNDIFDGEREVMRVSFGDFIMQ